MNTRPIAVAPNSRPAMFESMSRAVAVGGGVVSPMADAEALIWADARADQFREVMAANPEVEWVQLPYAGIENFLEHLDEHRIWTNAKGVYAPAVAETVVAQLLALCKNLHEYARAATWEGPTGRLLAGSRITVLGGGGITQHLLPLLAPFECDVTVVRRIDEHLAGATRTTTADRLHELLPRTDLLVLALALTPETRGIIDAPELAALPDHALIVNVARGGHIVTDALTQALRSGEIGGAALDVTDPEPLPDNHPLWSEPNCLITPHIANTPDMGLDLLEPFVTENVRRFCAGEQLLASVDVNLGY
ncbi:MAG: hydroxyacid dehydrogenase [Acidimicrobiaceae bacterium]|nr:hydroxyacid dehydrogenase [Acidimicrobiaceae bacterium]|tara:strand:- start:2735 stop:3655 length:921 start_codon:yes stop_codon:yes gene_type:complete